MIMMMYDNVSKHVPRSQKDLGSYIPRIQDIGPYVFIYSWDLRDLGSCHNIAMGSKGSWILDRKHSAGSWIQIEQVAVGSFRPWTLNNNNVTVF